jgi:ArsR family transcriptional regulator
MEIPEPLQCSIKGEEDVRELAEQLPDEKEFLIRSEMHHALSAPLRLKILYLLVLNPLCVCLIKEITKISDSKLSYHLSVLSDSGLIEGKREGNWIIYYPTKKGREIVEKGY